MNNENQKIEIEVDYKGFPTGVVCVVLYQCSGRLSSITGWHPPSCEIFSRIFVGTSLKEVHERAFQYAKSLSNSYRKVEFGMTYQGDGNVTFEVVESSPKMD